MAILTQAHDDHFDEYGYMVIEDAVPIELCEAVVDAIFDFLEMDPSNMNEERRQERITLWQERRALGRGPYPGDPRGWEAKNYGSPELTPLGQKLLGIDLWD